VEICFFFVEVYRYVVPAEIVACGMKRLMDIADEMDKEANSEFSVSESFRVEYWEAFGLEGVGLDVVLWAFGGLFLSGAGLLCTNGILILGPSLDNRGLYAPVFVELEKNDN